MSPKSYKIISIIFITISLLLIIGGCFAPWLFTGEGCERRKHPTPVLVV